MSYFCTNIAIKYMKKKTKRQHPSRKYREFSKYKEELVGDNYAKNVRNVLLDFRDDRNMSPELTMFLLWAYEYEFFTMDYLDKRCGIAKTSWATTMRPVLYKYGLLMTMYSKQSEGVSMEKMMMRNESDPSYRNRYALTQKAKLYVQEFYRKLDGRETIKRKNFWISRGALIDPQR